MNLGQTYRILIIDDDETVHGVYSCMLANDSGALRPRGLGAAFENGGDTHQTTAVADTQFPEFEIDFAFQGREGLEMVQKASAENRPYAMAFVDMRMPPGWTGIETIGHLWKASSELQVVICTGHADFSWHDLIREFGHSERLLVLKKPFEMTELRQVAYSLAEKWDLAHESRSHLHRLQMLVNERTAKLQEANHSLQRKINENTQAERRLMTQYSVSQALAQANTFEATIEIVFQIVCRSLDWDWAAFWQVDHHANLLKISCQWNAGHSDYGAFTKHSRDTLLEPGGSLPGRVWNTGQTLWINDIEEAEDFRRAASAKELRLHTAMGFPVTAGNRIFGVMEFISNEVRACDAEMMQTLEVIGRAVGQFLERKQAENDLKEQRDYVEEIIRETPVLVAGISPSGRTTFVNPAVTRHTGYQAGELIGHNWWDLFFPGEQKEQVELLFKKLAKGPLRDYETVLTIKDGSKRNISWNTLGKMDEAGELVELIGFGNDVTESKRAETEKAAMEIQLRHAQKLESIGQLAAGIAHEINTPTQYLGDNIRFLQTSFMDLESLQKQQEKMMAAARQGTLTPELVQEIDEAMRLNNFSFLMKEIPKAIEQSLEGVDRVARIVRAMKDFSHPGTGKKTPLDINKAIETTLTVAGNEWKYVSKMETSFAPNLPLVPCMPGEFNQVILNLVVNAAHAISDVVDGSKKQMGLIHVSTSLAGEHVEIRVRDTGTGIPEKIRNRIFDPFFTTKPVGRGTGQGLAIAHAVIVDQHQGQITFETEVGMGSTFIIRLPICPPAVTKSKGQQ